MSLSGGGLQHNHATILDMKHCIDDYMYCNLMKRRLAVTAITCCNIELYRGEPP